MNAAWPVLAVQMDVLGIIILVLTVLGYLVKAIKSSDEVVKGPPVRRPEGTRVRTEIETFLEGLNDTNRKRPPARPAGPAPERPRPPVKAVKKGTKAAAAAAPAKSPHTVKPVAPLAQTHLATAQLGQNLRTHVSTYMSADRMAAEVRQDVPSRIGQEVRQDLGLLAMKVPPPVEHPLVKLLRDPQGIRQAITLQEILQKPKALRRP